MKKLNRNEWIAVAVAVFVILLFFIMGRSLLSLFGNNPDQANQDQQTMQQAQQTASASGMTITDVIVGTGREAKTGDTISVHYAGKLADGTPFDNSYDRGAPFTFTLGAGQVIQGWEMGFAGMKVGGKRQIIIPSNLGYGASGVPGVIPPNATLVFDVELLNVR